MGPTESTESDAAALRLRVTLERRGPAAAIVLADDQVALLAAGTTFPVAVAFDGVTVPLRVARMGGENLIGLSKAVRAQLGVDAGDTLDVTITHDREPRQVSVPDALASALDADPIARAAFDALAPSRRKEHARAVTEAKREETRERRIAAIVESLR